MPYIGDGDVCGLDTDGDGCPDENLGCNEPFCFEVRDFCCIVCIYLQLTIAYVRIYICT